MNTKRILNISLYCFKSFPIRLLHSQLTTKGIETHSIFFKDSTANNHKPITDEEMKDFCQIISDVKPQIIGLSVLAPYVSIAKNLIAEIRKISQATIIMGGVYPTISPEEALEVADYICVGEGELVMDVVASRFMKGESFKAIEGLWYKDKSGKIVDTGIPAFLTDLDSQPFLAVAQPNMYFIENSEVKNSDPELIDKDLWVMTSRGCMYRCSYCVNSLYSSMFKGKGKFIRQRSPLNVIKEIEERLTTHITPVERIFFADELFSINAKWIEEFSALYKKKINIPFYMCSNPNIVKEDNIRLLSEVGLTLLAFGIQSGSEKLRNGIMNRVGSNRQIISAAWLLKKYNVEPVYDLILDNPFDTIDTLKETLDLILQLPKPFKFHVFKMQCFGKYPFSLAALDAGFIKEEDLSDDNVAQTCLSSWTFVPKIFSMRRIDHLQSCIYLIIRNVSFGGKVAKKMLESKNIFSGNLACLTAHFVYLWLIKTPAWIHRCVNAVRILLSGNLKKFSQRVMIQFQKKFSSQFNKNA